MSGGSLNYVYGRVEDAAMAIKDRSSVPLHIAFSNHLIKVAKALHDIEWLLSGDYGDGQEEEAIRAVVSQNDELDAATEKARDALKSLTEVLERIGSEVVK